MLLGQIVMREKWIDIPIVYILCVCILYDSLACLFSDDKLVHIPKDQQKHNWDKYVG